MNPPAEDSEVTAHQLEDLRRRLARARTEEEADIAQTRTDLARIGANLRRSADRRRRYLEGDTSAPD